AAAAVLYFGAAVWWFPDLDAGAVALASASVLAQSLATLYFSLFLGLNRAALWGLEAPLKGWGVVAVLPAAYLAGGLRGACGAVAAVDLLLLAAGILLARPHLGLARPRWDLRPALPYVRFGAAFLVSQLVVASFRRSGDVMVLAVSGSYAEVGYFGLAMNVYLVGALAMGQLALSFAPVLTGLREQGRPEAAARWVERLLVVLAAAGVAAVFGALALGETLVPLVFGQAYRPVAAHLLVMAFAL
ncbi:MAG: oligosaccharide flippase family protein, partial [Thermodesulfobacteriota bacterium]